MRRGALLDTFSLTFSLVSDTFAEAFEAVREIDPDI